MHDLLLQLLYDLLALLIPILVGYAIAWLQKRIGTEKLEAVVRELATKRELARVAVLFVQQAYKDLGGAEKYDKAAEWLSDAAGKIGIQLTQEEVKGLIEAALKELKTELGEAWDELAN